MSETETTEAGNEGAAEVTTTPADNPAPATPAAPAATTDWREAITDPDLKKKAQKYTSPAELAKAYGELESRLGNSVALPGDGASQEDIDKFYARLGRPEKAEDYNIGFPEGYEASEDDKAFVASIAPVFHKAGLSQKQVETLVADWNQLTIAGRQQAEQAAKQAHEKALAALKTEWAGDFEANVGFAKAAIQAFGGDELKQVLNDTGLGDNPALVKAMARIGRQIGEDGNLGVGLGADQRKSVEARLNELYSLINTDKERYASAEVQNEVKELNRKLLGAA